MLVGRASESARIDSLLDEVRGGAGCALVLLGEPGIGKSALLEYAGQQAADMKRLSILGVAAEAALPYAGLNELLRPVLWGLEALPARQSRAIRLALGAGGDGETDAGAQCQQHQSPGKPRQGTADDGGACIDHDSSN